jgi:hypothetical protein
MESSAFFSHHAKYCRNGGMAVAHHPGLASSIEFSGPRDVAWENLALPVLRTIPSGILAAKTKLNRSTIKRMRSGRTRPHRRNQDALCKIVVEYARAELSASGFDPPHDPMRALAAYLSLSDRHLGLNPSQLPAS